MLGGLRSSRIPDPHVTNFVSSMRYGLLDKLTSLATHQVLSQHCCEPVASKDWAGICGLTDGGAG